MNHQTIVKSSERISASNDRPASTSSSSSSIEVPPSSGRGRSQRFQVADFMWGSTLGEGSYARVIHAQLKSNQAHYAVKIMDKRHIRKENKIKQVIMEKNVLSKLSHGFIIKLWFTFQDAESLYLVMDLMTGGDLLHVIRIKREEARAEGRLQQACGENLARFYAGELIMALEYLHSKGVIHRDLKPENILVSATGHIKLTDFGAAMMDSPSGEAASRRAGKKQEAGDGEEEEERHNSFVGTAEYVSPEVLSNETATPGIDLWAVGCIIFQMLVGDPPFHGESDYLTFQRIMGHCNGSEPLAFPASMDSDAVDLIKRLLVRDLEARLGTGPRGSENDYSNLKHHPFFSNFEWEGILHPEPSPHIPSPSTLLTETMRDGTAEDWSLEPDAIPLAIENMMTSTSSSSLNGGGLDEAVSPTIREGETCWAILLRPGEDLILTSLVWKRNGLISKRRQLILTNQRRLIHVDPKSMEVKGSVPWTEESPIRPELRNEHAFDVGCPENGRTYHFTDYEVGALQWVKTLREALGSDPTSPPPAPSVRQPSACLGRSSSNGGSAASGKGPSPRLFRRGSPLFGVGSPGKG